MDVKGVFGLNMGTKTTWREFVNKINELQMDKPDTPDDAAKKPAPLLTFYNGADDVTVLRKKLTKE